MAISVDRVYRTVQRVMNIEERGQLPADDFNHIGNLAQNDLFNRLFYDKPHFMLNPKEGGIVMDVQDMIDVFVANATLTDLVTTPPESVTTMFSLPTDLYKIKDVYYNGKIVEKADHEGWNYIENSCLTQPTTTFPKYRRFEDTSGSGRIQVYPSTITSGVSVDYVKRPSFPEWTGMTVLGGTVLFNPNGSNDFDLHPAMEQDLIHRILYYAGVSLRQQDIVQAMQAIASYDEQIEKS